MSVVKFRECFIKFMILTSFFNNLSSQQLVSVVEVTNIRTYSCKMNKLPKYIYTIGKGAGTPPSRNGNLTKFQN